MKLTHSAIISALALGLVTAPAFAQQEKSDLTPEQVTAKLNREQAEMARQQLEGNAASQQAHDDAVRKQAEFEAEKTRLAQEHEQAKVSWQADVDACNAGDESRCAQPEAAAQ